MQGDTAGGGTIKSAKENNSQSASAACGFVVQPDPEPLGRSSARRRTAAEPHSTAQRSSASPYPYVKLHTASTHSPAAGPSGRARRPAWRASAGRALVT